ncbi:MAG: UDP-galactopyranose mutase [Enterococcus sp.]
MKKEFRPDVLVVGAGFAGSVCAREFAEKGMKVLVLEQRPHIAGNMFDGPDESGLMIHWYGPHIFHTNNRRVFHWLDRFTDWVPYEHRVLGRIQGQEIPIPFNFTAIDTLFPSKTAQQLKQRLIKSFPNKDRITISELISHQDEELTRLGEFIFENVFVHYTAKQWGISAEQVDSTVINRVPILLSYDDRYFQDEWQFMPKYGYTELFNQILNHENIICRLGVSTSEVLRLEDDGKLSFEGERFDGPVIYTGAPDQLLNYCFGRLAYRSLDLYFETIRKTRFQKAAVVNYPNEEKFTRITEFKQLTGQIKEGVTAILKEYPCAYTGTDTLEPYYPIETAANRMQYESYQNKLSTWKNLYLCGRLAQYKYFNMDEVIESALQLSAGIMKTH